MDPDDDNDGIPDVEDMDDDNDGILDHGNISCLVRDVILSLQTILTGLDTTRCDLGATRSTRSTRSSEWMVYLRTRFKISFKGY